jgi:hypothetical protein
VLLPCAGFALAVFAGWALPADAFTAALGLGPRGAALLRWTVRFVAPLGILGAALAPFLRG